MSHGETIGNYRILGELGRGGMGIVYKAEQVPLERFVALKVLYPHLCGDPVTVMRFNREARATGLLNHPNIVQIFDVGRHEDLHYFAMEYVSGKTLAQILEARGKLKPQEAITVLDQLAAALSAAHDVGLIHRDVKPSNLIVDDHGRVKVTDFGIALVAGLGDLTDTGHLVGTARYMSPEQAHGEDLDARSDLYSVGVVMFQMLAGQVPFDDPNPVKLLAKHVHDPVPSLRGLAPGTPDGVVRVVERLLEKAPADRFRTVRDFRHALREAVVEVDWEGAPLPPLESAGKTVAVDPSFAFDAAGPLHQVTDTVSLFMLDKLPSGKQLVGHVRAGLEALVARRLSRNRDSYKLQKFQVARLHDQLRNAEKQLESAKQECDRIYKKWEATDESLHNWQMHGSLSLRRPKVLEAEEAAGEEAQHWQRATSYKLQWRSLQEQVRDWYTNVERIRQEYEQAREDLTKLRRQRRHVSRNSGVTLRNRALLIAAAALVSVAVIWLLVRHYHGASPRPAPSFDFVKAGLLNQARDESAAVLLGDGRVLAAGGLGPERRATATAELYDPRTRTWSPTDPMQRARFNHTLEPLPDGNGLAIGGENSYDRADALASVEEYVTAQGRWAAVSSLLEARSRHRSVVLADHRVLVTGGRDASAADLAGIEIFDPDTNHFQEGGQLIVPRKDHTVTLLDDGTVLVIGGSQGASKPLTAIELYDPVAKTSRQIGQLQTARYEHTATLLADGNVLVIGGRTAQGKGGELTGVELVDPRTGSTRVLGNLTHARKVHTATLMSIGGRRGVLVVGGGIGPEAETCEFYDLAISGLILGPRLNYNRNNHVAVVLTNGDLLVLGGWGDDARTPLATTELFDHDSELGSKK